MIRVLIAEDSPSIQRMLTSLLSDQEGIEVVGVASNGLEAVAMCSDLQPDLVTMDIFMPKMDGLEATQRIMQKSPTRIVLISSIVDSQNLRNSFEAIRSGAVELIEKPHGVLRGNYSRVRDDLVRVIRQLMEAQPQRHFRSVYPQSPRQPDQVGDTRESEPPPKKTNREIFTSIATPDVICIGGSTGAPAVLSTILSHLASNYPVPILIAQHIATGFIQGMVEWLDSVSKIDVRIAHKNDVIRAGLALVAPDNAHLQVESTGKVRLTSPHKGETYVPSVDRLFESAAVSYGSKAVGIILSGMGRDGCSGLAKMRSQGAVTLAQSEQSSVVYGMPLVAFKRGAAAAQLDPYEMVDFLEQIAR